MAMAAREINASGQSKYLAQLEIAASQIAAARPTAVNLHWAVQRMLLLAKNEPDFHDIPVHLLAEAQTIQQEDEEITIIEQFMPAQLGGEGMVQAIDAVLQEVGAKTLKDMGPAMAALKEKYAGRMDFAKASAQVKDRLG